MADSIYTFDPVAANNTALDTIPYGPNQLYHNQIDNWFRALAAKLAQRVDDLGGVNTVAGTANAITATIASGITAYATGQLFWFKNTGGPNTTAATMSVNSIGAKEIRLQGDTALSGGEMLGNGYYGLLYDTAYDGGDGGWVLLNPSASVTFATNAQATQASSTTLSVNPANLANLYSIALGLAIEVADLKGARLNMAGGIADAYDTETDVDTATSTNEVYDAANDLYSPAPDPIALTQTDSAINSTLGTSMAMGTLSIGTAATDRDVVITGGSRFNGGTPGTLTSVTIDGVSATIEIGNVSGTVLSWVARLRVTSGTTAAIVVNSSGTSLSHTGIQVHRMTGASVSAPTTDSSTSTATPVTLTQTVPAGGAAVGCQIEDSTDITGMAYTAGLSETLEQALGTTFIRSAHGALTTATLLTAQAFTATRAGTRGSAADRYSIAIYSPSSVANMTIASNAFTATAVPTVARIAAFIDPQESITINTDFTAEASRDGGTTYTAVTLALVSNPVGTVEQYEGTASISAQPSGSSMKYRLKTLNNKDIDATGTVFQWG